MELYAQSLFNEVHEDMNPGLNVKLDEESLWSRADRMT